MTRFNSLQSRFAKDQDGTIALVFGFLLLVFCILIGLTIDGGRAVLTKSEMANALDSATLAATRALMTGNPTDAEIRTLATNYFNRNMESHGHLGGSFGALQITIDRSTKTVTIKANGRVPTTFAAMTTSDYIDISVESQATYNINDIELGLVLDTTGSMNSSSGGRGGKPKIDELKVAAAKMFDILLPDAGAPGDTRIGIAPFAASVNAGNFANAVTHGTSVDDCAVERTNANAYTDADPLPNNQQLESLDPRGRRTPRNYSCPNGTVLPLTNDKAALKRLVNGLDANGSTAGHLGTAWGWYLVSPNWNDVWAGAGVAKDYGTKNNVKSIVLMTDGAYNTEYYNGTNSANQAISTCTNAKAQGIIVYTIGFATTPAEEVTLNACASLDPDTGKPSFYHAENGEALTAAFADIAAKLGQLRMSR